MQRKSVYFFIEGPLVYATRCFMPLRVLYPEGRMAT